ncbi:MAG: hypothetical protein HY901_34630 [Deltaproteobacteria bacterium]|nr:hypothetical protein [Deltaproteobacteria bacterium]
MLNKRTILAILVAGLAALAGCGWQADGAARLEVLYPTPPPPPPPPPDPCPMPDDPGAAAASVTGTCSGLTAGRWAVRVVQFGSMSPAGMGPWNITLTDQFVAGLSADSSSLELSFCTQGSTLTDKDGKPIAFGKTRIPDKTRTALGKAGLSLPLPGDGTFSVADVAWLWGTKNLANPLTDPLPAEAGDAKVWDQDEDGKPGVTMQVENPAGERYMARRSRWTFKPGQISAESTWVTGEATFAISENALGASIESLKIVAPITPRGECRSVYQMRCVDAAFSCTQLLANATTLFRDAPR